MRRREVTARGLALKALERIDEGAFANLVLGSLLERSRLADRDRAFATSLTYGTTRMRRACDWLIDAHLDRPVERVVRAALRLGVYQLVYLRTPSHAAVEATVSEAPVRARGLVNAVLRKVSGALPPAWPNKAVELSYPDWIVDRLEADLGKQEALDALAAMNVPVAKVARTDGYVQDAASQWVAELVGARRGERVADLCAAPGGKATALASGRGPNQPAIVIASDVRISRAELIARNARRLESGNLSVMAADVLATPLRPRSVNRVLLDAPCSGLGALRHRPDARWRVTPSDVGELAGLQRQLLKAAISVVSDGGVLVYSVCTLTRAETAEIDDWLAEHHPEAEALPVPGHPWQALGRGALLLPQQRSSDGMFLLRVRLRWH